ncbi:MAG: NAD(P)-dependent oxidoreductase [Candidatus Moranbacteria bacterium]|jgi:dTDP-4-dehydrorhamnose reductase|nr:NAD(P)-dependent oxidoreductase [Candidatus Moranbacteria bacterium]MDX9855210.1 NAD(P)-dependent oxidoreductase [Candidatus Moranbacteria bacterium]
MKKVLIIGSRGMLGQELVKVFKKDKDFEVVGWDRDDIDITDKKNYEKKIKGLKPDIILNAAAYNAVDRCEGEKKEFELAKKINGLAPGYLAEIAKEIDAVFVHYSTDYVFGAKMPEILEPEGCGGACSSCTLHDGFEPEIGFKEDDRPAPVNNYGKSKLLGEKEVLKKGEKYYIIRLSKLFGKPSKSESGKRSFFDIMLEAGKKNKKVKAVDEETSCFTYAPDLAQKSKEIVEAEKYFGIYHVVNSDPCTWFEAVEELYAQVGLKTKIEPVSGDEFPRPAQRPYFSVLLNKKLNPLRSYKDALRDYLKELK